MRKSCLPVPSSIVNTQPRWIGGADTSLGVYDGTYSIGPATDSATDVPDFLEALMLQVGIDIWDYSRERFDLANPEARFERFSDPPLHIADIVEALPGGDVHSAEEGILDRYLSYESDRRAASSDDASVRREYQHRGRLSQREPGTENSGSSSYLFQENDDDYDAAYTDGEGESRSAAAAPVTAMPLDIKNAPKHLVTVPSEHFFFFWFT